MTDCPTRLGDTPDGLRCTRDDGHAWGHVFQASSCPQANDTEAVDE